MAILSKDPLSGEYKQTPNGAPDWSDYYRKVLANPTATSEAKSEARMKLGMENSPAPSQSLPFSPTPVNSQFNPQSNTQSNPLSNFNMAILDMLQKAQGGGTAGNENLFAQQTALQRAQIGRVSDITPEELRNLSPSQQSSIRNASAGSLSPEIDAISAKIKASDMRLQNFERIVGVMREMGQEVAKLNPSEEVITGYKKMIEAGGSISAVPEEIRDKVLQGIDWKLVEENRLQALRSEAAIAHSYDNSGLGSGDYTPAQQKFITKLNQDISKNQTYLKTNSMRNFKDNVISALELGTGISDIAAINQFQKVIDEGAVTRDQDVVLIQSAQSLMNQLQTKMKGLQSGDKLSYTQRAQMKNLVEKIYDTQVKALLKDPYIAAKNIEVKINGLTPEDTILGELGGFNTSEKPPTMILNGQIYDLQSDGNYELREVNQSQPQTDTSSIKSFFKSQYQ